MNAQVALANHVAGGGERIFLFRLLSWIRTNECLVWDGLVPQAPRARMAISALVACVS